MAQIMIFKGLLALGAFLLQLLLLLFVPTFPVTRKRSAPSQKTTWPLSWFSFKRFLSCASDQNEVHDPRKEVKNSRRKCYHNIGCAGSLHALRDIIHGNAKVMQRPEVSSPESSTRSTSSNELVVADHGRTSMGSGRSFSPKTPLSVHENHGSFRGMHLRKLSGCYECHVIVEPIESISRDISLRATIYSCQVCGEIFSKSEALEQHQVSKHAVSELALDDSARNIVDIIFKTSWLKKETTYKIEKILKIHNSAKTINRFEDYRDMVKAKANKSTKKHPRCIADGNELLRFHCTSFTCSLGTNGFTSLCSSTYCNVCNIIRNGFSSKFENGKGIYTTSGSGKAHDSVGITEEDNLKLKRAMLVCRVIAGRVIKSQDTDEFLIGGYDSMAGEAGVYSNMDELYVINPKAVLPCFVVMYRI